MQKQFKVGDIVKVVRLVGRGSDTARTNMGKLLKVTSVYSLFVTTNVPGCCGIWFEEIELVKSKGPYLSNQGTKINV